MGGEGGLFLMSVHHQSTLKPDPSNIKDPGFSVKLLYLIGTELLPNGQRESRRLSGRRRREERHR